MNILRPIFFKLDNSARQCDFISWKLLKLCREKFMYYLVGVWILNIRFSTTWDVSHQYFFDFGHQNNFRMWVAYRKYSLCTKEKGRITKLINIEETTLKTFTEFLFFFFLKNSFKEIFMWEIAHLMSCIGKKNKTAFSVASWVNKSATCFGNFSHSSGNPLTWGSSDCRGVTVSLFPFSKAAEDPESICRTAVWFKSTWKSAEIFLLSLRS